MNKTIVLSCPKCKVKMTTHLENADARCPRCKKNIQV